MIPIEQNSFDPLRPKSSEILPDPGTLSVENRLFNLMALLCGIIGFLIFVLSAFNPNGPYDIVLSLTVMVFGTSAYISSIVFQNDRYLRIPMIIMLTGVLCVFWVTNSGLNGSAPVYFVIAFVGFRILVEGGPAKTILFFIIMIVAGLVVLDFYFPQQIPLYTNDTSRKIDIGVGLLISLSVVAVFMHLLVKEYREAKDRSFLLYQQVLKDKVKLEEAFTEIGRLKGILSLCSFCKKIRDDNDEWHSLESYISSRVKVEFSHSFCPDCGDKHYAEYTNLPV